MLVSHSFVSDWRGGVEVYVHDMAHALQDAGVDVSIFYSAAAAAGREPRLIHRKEFGLKVYRLETPVNHDFGLTVRNESIEALFRQAISKSDCNLIHFHHTWIALPFSLFGVAKQAKLPVHLTLHDAWFACGRTHMFIPERSESCETGPDTPERCARCVFSGSGEVAPALVEAFARRRDAARAAFDACDLVTAPSRYLIGILEGAGFPAGHIKTTPLGVTPVHAPRQKREEVVFGFLGTFSRLKNAEHMARSFGRVEGRARLQIHGSGSAGPDLMSEIERDPRMNISGPYEAADLPQILSGIDVLVLPSLSENYPVVAREALSAGVPVLASRVGGIPEIVSHEKNGLLFDPRDPNELEYWLRQLISQPERIAELRAGIGAVKTIDQDAHEWRSRYKEAIPSERRNGLQSTPPSSTPSGNHSPLEHGVAALVRSV
ncbi:MAG: glycosyltransferase family 4 protein [bacterium]|nr:glycosyltransferase family 4 protein [bacterium]